MFFCVFDFFAVGFLNILNDVSCWHCSSVILLYMFYFGLIVVMVVFWWYFLSNEHVCFLFAVFSVGLVCMLLELFVLGHVSFVWLFAGYFWDLCMLLELFALGHVSCVFTCASWIWLSVPYMRVLFCVYLNVFFDVFFTCDNWFTWEMFLFLVWCFCV